MAKLKRLDIVMLLVYVLVLIYIYYFRFANPDAADYVATHENITLVNLIPFKNIVAHFHTNQMWAVKYNILFPILLWLPAGYFVFALQQWFGFLKAYLLALAFAVLIYLVRLWMGLGFFDIDKIIVIGVAILCAYFVSSVIYRHCLSEGLRRI